MIDDKTYNLSEVNFFNEQTIKKRIVICHTSSDNMQHIIKWKNRMNGRYKKTAAFTVTREGLIYQHFDPIYFSELFGNIEEDKKNIIILLENDGWLIKDDKKNQFINWSGYIYNKVDVPYEKKWRGYQHWAPYSEIQFESTIFLVEKICNEFYIKKNIISDNTKIDNVEDFSGVLYRSNFEKHYTDLSPAWDFYKFKEIMENKL